MAMKKTLVDSFRSARENGVQYPKMYLETCTLKLSPDTGKNPHNLYITDNLNGEYVGRITPTCSLVVGDGCSELIAQELERAIANPYSNSKIVGKETGSCCCCGRLLTNPLSVSLGIGPICRDNWFPEELTPVSLELPVPVQKKVPTGESENVFYLWESLEPTGQIEVLKKILGTLQESLS